MSKTTSDLTPIQRKLIIRMAYLYGKHETSGANGFAEALTIIQLMQDPVDATKDEDKSPEPDKKKAKAKT